MRKEASSGVLRLNEQKNNRGSFPDVFSWIRVAVT